MSDTKSMFHLAPMDAASLEAGVKGAAAPILTILNDCTPLPKDLQLLIVEYWRPVRRLMVYCTDTIKFEGDTNNVEWRCLPHDSRVKLPPVPHAPGYGLKVYKFKRGLMIERYNDPLWCLDYYPDIYSSSFESIPIDCRDWIVVLGKKLDILTSFYTDVAGTTFKIYNFGTRVWEVCPYPNDVRTFQPSIYRWCKCAGKVYFYDATRRGYLYDGASWSVVDIDTDDHSDYGHIVPLFITDTTICYTERTPNDDLEDLFYFSISTGKLIVRKKCGGEGVTAVPFEGNLLIHDSTDLFIYDCATEEMIKAATGADSEERIRPVKVVVFDL